MSLEQGFSVVWLIGGTSEAITLANGLASQNIPVMITVATTEAISRYPQSSSVEIQSCRLTKADMVAFICERKLTRILDASHPFATEVSKFAIAAAQITQIPYLRYEREEPTFPKNEWVTEVSSFEELLNDQYLVNQRVLLTMGVKSLPHFQPWQSRSQLFARILPRKNSYQQAFAAGFTTERLIALKPPITFEQEKDLWQSWQIERVITKASGIPGGENIKRELAERLHIPLVIWQRPNLQYPQLTQNLESALGYALGQHLFS
ncbi:MAG: cobalt-precorrin-6A reductase [Cyanobacteria bacterium P01_H01_bin.15]